MADNSTGNFGGINREELRSLQEELRLFSQGVADAGKAMNQALRAGGAEDLTTNLTRAVNAGKSLAEVTKEDLKSQRGRNEIADKYNTIKRAQNTIEANILILKKKIELADKASIDSLGKALLHAVDLQGNLEIAAENASKLAGESKKVAEAGEGFAKMAASLSKLPLVGGMIAKPLQAAAEAAKQATADGLTPGEARLKGWLALSKSIALTIGSAILGALVQASSRLGEINKQLGVGIQSARNIADEYERYATNSEDVRITTDKLIKANGELNAALGTTVAFSGETLDSFIKLTEYMGVSAQSAARIETLSRTSGQNTDEFAGNLAKSVHEAGKANGIFMSTGTALEKIKNVSSATLLILNRNPKAIGETLIAVERLGLSFEQLNNTANSLLNFEESISNELEAELLTGRELNLERARAAALMGDQETLARELTNQVGTAAEFGKMNVIQQESLAKAFGLTRDSMADMLLKQELLNSLGEEANDLTSEQAAKIRQMVKDGDATSESDALLKLQQQQDVAKRFQDTVEKMKSAFVDFFEDFEPALSGLVDTIKSLVESKLFKVIAGGLTSTAGLAAVIGTMAMGKLRGATPMTPMFVTMAGAGGAGGFGNMLSGGGQFGGGLYNKSGYYLDGKLVNVNGKIPKGAKFMRGGLTSMGKGLGAGMIGGLAGMGLNYAADQYEEGSTANVALGTAGGALSMAGTGAMMGSMFGPVGTLVGGGLGLAIGGLTSFLERKEKKEEKEKLEKKEEKDHFSEMTEQLRIIAKKDTELYMDSNKVGMSLVQGNPQLGN